MLFLVKHLTSIITSLTPKSKPLVQPVEYMFDFQYLIPSLAPPYGEKARTHTHTT